MPVIKKPNTWDPASIASRLPESLQWIGGAALGGLKELSGGDDPNVELMGTVSPMMAAEGELTPFAQKGVNALKGLYSRVSNVASKLPEAIHPNKAMSLFKNQASGEEIGYRKLDEFLKGKGNQMVPKEDILSHLEANREPQIGVKTLSGNRPPIKTTRDFINDLDNVTDPKYEDYQLPGGENYKENLITYHDPRIKPKTEFEHTVMFPDSSSEELRTPTYDAMLNYHRLNESEMTQGIYRTNTAVGGPEYGAQYADQFGGIPTHANEIPAPSWLQDPSQVYVSSHWDEPNVLVHSRTQDRPISDVGNIRNIENIQSDWHQQGAQHGYGPSPQEQADLEARIAALNDEDFKIQHEINEIRNTHNPHGTVESYYDQPWSEDYDLEAHGRFQAEAIPLDARREAIERELNDLHAQLPEDYLGVNKRVPDAPFKDSWLDLGLKHQIMDVAGNPNLEGISVTPGSEMIKRGEGRSPQFNDVQVPNALQRLLKPFGGTPSTVEIPGKAPRVSWDPNASKYGGAYNNEIGGNAEAIASHSGIEPDMFGNLYKLKDYQTPAGNQFINYVKAHQYKPSINAPYFQITPKMKEELLKKGLPLMSILGLAAAQPQFTQEDQ